MRVNIYGEELTDRVEVVSKAVAEPETGESFTFYGLRFWLKFPNQPWWIHRKVDGAEDDDSSAVTIWAPSRGRLHQLLQAAAHELTAGDDHA